MNFKKLFIVHLLVMHTCIQSSSFSSSDTPIVFPVIDSSDIGKTKAQRLILGGAIIGGVALVTYLWATSGDSVEQRIKDAQNDLATMPEYDQEFDMAMSFDEKETQIITVLNQISFDIDRLDRDFDEKLQNDLVTINAAYNNLWYKSFYGGREIAEITRKTHAIKTKIEALLQYLKVHRRFIQGHQIMNESTQLLSRKALHNHDEIKKTASVYDTKSNYPLYNYVKKIQDDLACIQHVTTDKKALREYPKLSEKIVQYEQTLIDLKNIITGMEDYKQQSFNKIESDIAMLMIKCEYLEAKVRQLEFDVAMARSR